MIGFSDETPIDLSHLLHSNDLKLVRHVKTNSLDYISKRLLTQSSDNRNSSGKKQITPMTESNDSLIASPDHKKIFNRILRSPSPEGKHVDLGNSENGFKVPRLKEKVFKTLQSRIITSGSKLVAEKPKNYNPFNPFSVKKKTEGLTKKGKPLELPAEKYDYVLDNKPQTSRENEKKKLTQVNLKKLPKTYSQLLGDVDKEFSAVDVPLARTRLKLSVIRNKRSFFFLEENLSCIFPLNKIIKGSCLYIYYI